MLARGRYAHERTLAPRGKPKGRPGPARKRTVSHEPKLPRREVLAPNRLSVRYARGCSAPGGEETARLLRAGAGPLLAARLGVRHSMKSLPIPVADARNNFSD